MLFNIDKCKVMHLGYNNPKADYVMDGSVLHPVIDVADTRSETLHCHYSVADCQMKVKLAVISILV